MANGRVGATAAVYASAILGKFKGPIVLISFLDNFINNFIYIFINISTIFIFFTILSIFCKCSLS